MRFIHTLIFLSFAALILPACGSAQAVVGPNGIMLIFEHFADEYGSRLVAAFDSIPADRYGYRPTPAQQSVGYIAQHLEQANYALCERLSDVKHPRAAADLLADTVKARWPKDTLVSRLRASLRFCDDVLDKVGSVRSAADASTLLAFETDLAEHYSQLAVYMRLLGLTPPSALPPRSHVAIALPRATLADYVGVYRFAPDFELQITIKDASLVARANTGNGPVTLWAESSSEFFVKEADVQVTFIRDATGAVTGLVLHRYGRDRTGVKQR